MSSERGILHKLPLGIHEISATDRSHSCYFLAVRLVEARDLARLRRRLQIYDETRTRLRQALSELLPGQRVVLFGSLTQRGVFNDRSDVDIALYEEAPGMNSWQLTGELIDRLQRPVDVVLLPRCRFREKILREGETWTL